VRVTQNFPEGDPCSSLGRFSTTPGNLTFNIDWFNPFTNKIAGKTVSAGIILATCLNIPYELQESLGATCHLGITPLPREPSVSTINHLTSPIVSELEELWEGVIIPTFRHPEGIQKRVGVLSAIGDLLGMRKLLGYAAVNAQKFCSFCDLDHENLSAVDQGIIIGQLRTGEDVRRAGRAYRDAPTIEKREEILRASGVRFSAVQQLSYRDPVRHTVLGMMHNWLEGLLQNHARVKWGIGGSTSNSTQKQKNRTASSVIGDETELTHEVAYEENEAETNDGLTDSGILSMMDSENMDRMSIVRVLRNHTQHQQSTINISLTSQCSYCRSTSYPETFNKELLSRVRSGLAAVTVPSWVERPPTNLGEKRHGKLKADTWRILFTVFLPLILPELWHDASLAPLESRSKKLLENFHLLVYCTNIVCSYTVTSGMPELYTQYYHAYLLTSKQLFPHAKPRPNHHYAMHNTEQLRFWGPLPQVSEFFGERQNGQLQSIQTNGIFCAFQKYRPILLC
jgi:hypothetical protein